MIANIGHVMTLANSIIGVGILAMPFCFEKCGIILSILLLILSNLTTRICCHYLVKSSMLTRRKSFEFLAFHSFGSSGKLMVELCIIGYLIGTCIAYFVVVGEVGPQITAKVLNIQQISSLRTWVMVIVTFTCIIPLGLLKNVDSLAVVCTASFGFYICLVIKVIAESKGHILAGDWMENIEYWKPSGVLQCLPIFSMALSCQMQLFEVFETVPNVSVEKMNDIVKSATGICTCVYILVGFFGYVAFSTQNFSGNILVNFSQSFASDAIKMGFVLSVAFSFPLVIFPCRASIYSLLYRRGHSDNAGYIPELRFKAITVFIVITSLCLGLVIPSIELVIGLVGSTIGVAICVMFPASCFIKISKKDSTEKILAKFIIVIGFVLMILGTYANLTAIDEKRSGPEVNDQLQDAIVEHATSIDNLANDIEKNIPKEPIVIVNPKPLPFEDIKERSGNFKIEDEIKDNLRAEILEKIPNNPPPIIDLNKQPLAKENLPMMRFGFPLSPKLVAGKVVKNQNNTVNIDKDAIKKEDEIAAEESQKENEDQIKETKIELKKTKEELEKKVDELKEELAKKNKETQDLVLEKLEEFAEKVEQIEKDSHKDAPKDAPKDDDNARNEAINNQDTKMINNIEDHNKSVLLEGTLKELTINQSIDTKPVENNVDYKNGKQMNKGPIINLLATGVKEEIKITKTDEKPAPANTVYEPDSYKLGEAMNSNSRALNNSLKVLIPLPILLNDSLHNNIKSTNDANDTKGNKPAIPEIEKLSLTENKKDTSQTLLKSSTLIVADVKSANNINQPSPENDLNKNENLAKKDENLPKKDENASKKDENLPKKDENIESIRRDILEVNPKRQDSITTTTSDSSNKNDINIIREKRDLNRDSCINLDMKLEDCFDQLNSNDLLSSNVVADIKVQNFGRDLKSVDEKT